MQAQCHCRECRSLTGGAANVFMAVPKAGLTFIQGAPKSFSRDDLPAPVTRDFCANCGTHLLTRSPNLPDAVILKVGSLDDPTEANPAIAIYTCDQLPFQTIPPGVASFEHLPT